MIQHSDRRYGPDSRDLLAQAHDPSADGARAVLESFSYALNGQHGETLRQVWSSEPLAQLNNPLGGILRGGAAIADLYDGIFDGPVRLQVTFEDVVEFLGTDAAIFAGRETGSYTTADGVATPLQIRTTRYFGFHDGAWRQLHHHGSIDDAHALRSYQEAVAARRPGAPRDG